MASDKNLIKKIISDSYDDSKNAALVLRKNAQIIQNRNSDMVKISTLSDRSGLKIQVAANATDALIILPTIITKSGLDDVVVNDFYIGENANAVIFAGCGIDNDGKKNSHHQGKHRFFVGKNAQVKYIERHYANDHDDGNSVLDPITEIFLDEFANFSMETLQMAGVDSAKRSIKVELSKNSSLEILEKIMTTETENASTKFELQLNGENSSARIVSRAVASGSSQQIFLSDVCGNERCTAHVECDAIILDNAKISSTPKISANHAAAKLIHEAQIGQIAKEQLIKLMSLGLDQKSAEEEIIKAFLK